MKLLRSSTIGDEEELPIQPISSIRSVKKLIKPTHDLMKKKKRRKNRGKKVSLPNKLLLLLLCLMNQK